ncbi:hypothetical protein MPNT_280021 [Candidatus Methylacidithermus pantelleriae]|uniref:Uncharacterized protein n=1 Tax=Candidatus Methylacidithermus pantelleriae TaxID=2744239 RepID=A0A8J2BNC8_9BACT|nr:hypothetical protein MPNT_280021 [Candidatus Methylacidithermus pantelleriae]
MIVPVPLPHHPKLDFGENPAVNQLRNHLQLQADSPTDLPLLKDDPKSICEIPPFVKP